MRQIISLLLLFSSLSANPSGEKVTAGSANFHRDKNLLQIEQKSVQAIIEWKDFSIQAGETTRFLQKKEASCLNRVKGGSPSKLYGKLQGDGTIYLINPNGIVIGPKGVIETKGFVASTLQLSDAHFLEANEQIFSGNGKLINLGKISATDVYLLGEVVENAGTIRGKNVSLMGGQSILLSKDGKAFVKKGAGSIDQKGVIECVEAELLANGGNLYPLAINAEGIISATAARLKNGRVILDAMESTLEVSGEVTAKNMRLLGEQVTLKEEAKLTSPGGEILIGGDYKGQNPEVKNSKRLYTGPDVLISADGEGDGGKVILWADDANLFYGSISAKGGKEFGDGGFVEISSGGYLAPDGKVSTRAPAGKKGTLLLDPPTVTVSGAARANIATPPAPPPPPPTGGPYTYTFGAAGTAVINDANLVTFLNDNDVTIDATTGGGTTGSINFTTPITWTSPTTLTCISERNITIGADITNNSTGYGVGVNALDLQANQGVANTGNFIGVTITGTIETTEGNINIDALGGNTGNDRGIQLTNGVIRSIGTGTSAATITLDGQGGAGGNNCYGVFLTGASASITSVDGNISITGTSDGTNNNNHGIFLNTSASITSTGTGTDAATITLNGTGSTSGNQRARGVFLNNSSVISSVDGNINITAQGGSDGTNNAHTGMLINNGSDVISSGTGANAATITIMATGGPGTTNNFGLQINQVGSLLTTNEGAIDITATGNTGTGANNNWGLYIDRGLLTSTGSAKTGSITAVGNGAPTGLDNCYGARLRRSNGGISSDSGNISLTGNGGGTDDNNRGIFIQQTAMIESVGTGADAATITLIGNAGGGAAVGNNNNQGIFMDDLSSSVTSIDGNVSMTGTGDAAGNNNHGILMQDNSDVTITGTGTLTMVGTGSTTANNNTRGILLNNADVSVTSGTLTATGTGGGSGTAAHGIMLQGTGNFTTSTGNITLTGTGGPAAATGAGVFFTNGQVTSTSSGDISITGDGVGALDGVDMNNAADFIGSVTDTGDITICADTVSLTGTIQSTGNCQLKPISAASSIGIGTGSTGTFNLTQAEISTLVDGFTLVTIGENTSTGMVDIQPATFLDPLAVFGMTIDTTGTLTNAGNAVTFNIGPASMGTLNLNAGTVITSSAFTVNGGAFDDTFNIDVSAQAGTLNGGGGTNTLNGPDFTNAWTVTGAGSGTLNSFTFTDMQFLVGAATMDDTFTFTAAGQITGLPFGIDGNGGSNSITGPPVDNAWSITGVDEGSITPSGFGATTFTAIETWTGGTAADVFTFAGDFNLTGSLAGGGGTNTIVGPDSINAWAITGAGIGTITPGAAPATPFSDIQNLTGRTMDDTFTFVDGAAVTGLIDGGIGGTNTYDLSAYTTDTFSNLSSGASTGAGSIANLNNFFGGTATNTLTSPNATNLWSFTAANTGNINGAITFTTYQNVAGGTGADTFDFSSGFLITGSVDGGAGSNTLIAPNLVNSWVFTADDAGVVAGLPFANIGNPTGGTMDDTFIFTDAVVISGLLDGGAPPINTLDYSLYTQGVNIVFDEGTSSGTASNILGGFINIQQIIGPNVVIISPAQVEGVVTSVLTAMSVTRFYEILYKFLDLNYTHFYMALNGVLYKEDLYRYIVIDEKTEALQKFYEESLANYE